MKSDIKTKFYQEDSIILKMVQEGLKCNDKVINVSLLKGGMKNAVYLIQTENDKFVLKIAPENEEKMLTFERNTMEWEANTLKIMEQHNIPSPRLLCFDKSGSICKVPYIFMTYIQGKTLSSQRGNLTPIELENIEFEIGKISSRICDIKGDKLYVPSFAKKFTDNFELVLTLYNSLMEDADRINLKINGFDNFEFLNLLKYFKKQLNNVNNICYAHYDLWDGNVLIENNKITGIVDFADVYIADELMTFYFHDIHQKISESFLMGFGKSNLSNDEIVRTIFYKILVLLKMIIEKNYKNFNELSSYDWINAKINQEVKKLNNLKK